MQEEYEYENPCQEFRSTLAELNDWQREHWIYLGKVWFSRDRYGCHDLSSRMGSQTTVSGQVTLVIQCLFSVQPFYSMKGFKMAKPNF